MEARTGITVAIPSYNGARHVGEALRSVLSQTVAPDAILVSDDRSSDETIEVVRRVGGDCVRVIENSERLGLAGNWNQCVRLAPSAFVAIVHQDDAWAAGHLASHAQRVLERPELGFIASGCSIVDDDGNSLPPDRIERPDLGPTDRWFEAGQFLVELAVRNPVRCSGVTLSKRAHQAEGGFRPELKYAVDWDFWARVARRNVVAWTAEATVRVRWHSASETHTFKTVLRDLDEVGQVMSEVREWLKEDGIEVGGHKVLQVAGERRLARAYVNRAYEAARGGDRPLLRKALGRAWSLDRWGTLSTLRSPRLLARLAAGLMAGDSPGADAALDLAEGRGRSR